MTEAELRAMVEREARELGFSLVGVTRPEPSGHTAFYRSWIADGRHGEMIYLARDEAVARRADLSETMPEVASVIAVAHEYFREDPDGVPADPSRAVLARYARGRDYHVLVDKKLRALLRRLDGAVEGGVRGRSYVDTGPLLERELAQRAGLGWFGKNTMLINPSRGSYFFIGVLLVDVELAPDPPFEEDRCGSCKACLDACPTNALLGRDASGAPIIDARRCISYLTIELRGAIPEELREPIGNRVFGCDICQEVCPWNERFAEEAAEPGYAPRGPGALPAGVELLPGERSSAEVHPGTDAPQLVDLMRMTREDWDAFSRGSPIRRTGYSGFRRNVAVALGNWLASVEEPPPEALAVLRAALEEGDELVREHAAWALERANVRDGASVPGRPAPP